jgi:predicted permease
LPGVVTVATSRQIPFGGDWSTDIDAPLGGTPNAADGGITVGLNAVTDDYFGLVGVQILAGRAFGPGDRQGAAAVTVINEALAELLWPGEDPIGRVLEAGESGFLVVGLARDATYYELGEEPKTQAYVHELQIYMSLVHFLVKTEADAAALAPVVQAELRRLDPTLAFGRVTTMASVVEEAIARYKVSAVLVGLFGAIALLLATAGLYGTVSYLVSRRTREIGVRMALGADRGRVARQVFQAGLRLAALGTVLGLAGAVAFRGLTESLLFGVEPADPIPLAGACVALFAVTALASLGPARRATRIDPIDAIRSD